MRFQIESFRQCKKILSRRHGKDVPLHQYVQMVGRQLMFQTYFRPSRNLCAREKMHPLRKATICTILPAPFRLDKGYQRILRLDLDAINKGIPSWIHYFKLFRTELPAFANRSINQSLRTFSKWRLSTFGGDCTSISRR